MLPAGEDRVLVIDAGQLRQTLDVDNARSGHYKRWESIPLGSIAGKVRGTHS